MNKFENIHDWIDRFNENELTDEEVKEFETLLREDPSLQAEVRLDKELNEMLQDEDLLSFRTAIHEAGKKQERKGNHRKIFLLAASLLLFVILPVVLFLVLATGHGNLKDLRVNQNGGSGQEARKNHAPDAYSKDGQYENRQIVSDSIAGISQEKPGDHKPLIADANFKPFPPYESLTGTRIRSEKFTLLRPASGSHFHSGDTIIFSWQASNPHQLTLQIMDNHGKAVRNLNPSGEMQIKIPPGSLHKGLFYFKIMKEDNIVFFGKFILDNN